VAPETLPAMRSHGHFDDLADVGARGYFGKDEPMTIDPKQPFPFESSTATRSAASTTRGGSSRPSAAVPTDV
jgi:hypothetical protein